MKSIDFSFHSSQLFCQIQLNVNVKICCESVVVYCKAYVSLPSLAIAFPAHRCRHARFQNDNVFFLLLFLVKVFHRGMYQIFKERYTYTYTL